MDPNDALVLGRRMWQQIELQRHGRGVDEPRNAPPGLHGYLDYYRGVHPLRYASAEFEAFHQGRYAGFSDNWCAPVVDAKAERLATNGIRLGEDTSDADRELQRVWDSNEGDSGLAEAITVAIAAGRSYGLVWGNPSDPDTPRITFEHPEFCGVAYDAETGQATANAKAWIDGDRSFLTLYTSDEVWKWQWSVPKDADPRRPVEWSPRQPSSDDTWPIRNPLGVPPMVELRNTTLLDDRPISGIAGVAAMQDAINLVWAYLFNALDFASLPQRVAMGAEIPKVPILDAEGQVIGTKDVDLQKMLRDRIMFLTGTDAKIGSWPAAALDVFTNVIGVAQDHVAAQTRTPPHYLIGKMANMAAEALTVAETGLVSAVRQLSKRYTPAIRGLYQRIALAQGDQSVARAALAGHVLWANPQYRSLAQQTDAFQKMRQGGMPLEYMLEWLDLPPSEVARVLAMAKREADVLIAPKPIPAAPGDVLPKGNSEVTVDSSLTPPFSSAPQSTPAT